VDGEINVIHELPDKYWEIRVVKLDVYQKNA